MEERIKVLAEFLELNEEETEEITKGYYDNQFDYGNQEYLVLTDQEANAKAREIIEGTLWVFKAEFIIEHCSTYQDMNHYEYESAVKSLQKAQESECENLNGLVRALIEDMDDFVEDAIMTDGRGQFISYYDGKENEQGDYFIYRI